MFWIVLLAFVSLVVVVGAKLLMRGSVGFPPGTRAFEAQLTIPLLTQAILLRQDEMDSADPARKQTLRQEIDFLGRQLDENQSIVNAGDLSPGKGYVGFEAPPV